MSYITDGTFWVVVLILAAAIGIMWYSLKKQADRTAEDLAKLRKTLGSSFREIGDATEKEEKKVNDAIADLYDNLSMAYKILAILQMSSSKATQTKINNLFKENKKRA